MVDKVDLEDFVLVGLWLDDVLPNLHICSFLFGVQGFIEGVFVIHHLEGASRGHFLRGKLHHSADQKFEGEDYENEDYHGVFHHVEDLKEGEVHVFQEFDLGDLGLFR